MSNFPNPWSKTLADVKTYRRQLPNKISGAALKEMQGYFRVGGYRDTSTIFWEKRKTSNWGKKKKKDNVNRALLVKSGRLRRSLRKAADFNFARVVTDVEYAEALHKGFKGIVIQRVRSFKRRGGTVKAHTRTVKRDMTARPFLTVGQAFYNVLDKQILNELEQLFIRS